MALANDAILLTPGSGATLAAASPGGSSTTRHQVTMPSNSGGFVAETMPTYGLTIPNLPLAANKYHWEFFNHPSSGKTVTVRGLWPSIELGVGNTGIHPDRFTLYRTTALSSGGTASAAFESATTTQANFFRLNPGDASLSSHITAQTTLTSITTGTFLWQVYVSSLCSVRTPKLLFTTQVGQLLQNVNYIAQREFGEELGIGPGTGIAMRQGSVVASGSMGWLLEFTVDP